MRWSLRKDEVEEELVLGGVELVELLQPEVVEQVEGEVVVVLALGFSGVLGIPAAICSFNRFIRLLMSSPLSSGSRP